MARWPVKTHNVGQATGSATHEAPYLSRGLVRIDSEPLNDVAAISAYGLYSLALKKDGTLVAWGAADFTGRANVPEGMSDVIAVAAGGMKLAITTNQAVAERYSAETAGN